MHTELDLMRYKTFSNVRFGHQLPSYVNHGNYGDSLTCVLACCYFRRFEARLSFFLFQTTLNKSMKPGVH